MLFDGVEILVLVDEGDGPLVMLAHGAGSHMEHKTIEWLSSLVREAGGRVARFNFAYRERGKSMPDRMPKLIATYDAVLNDLKSGGPIVIGGHSMGGRVASMLLAEKKDAADGLVLFGYPLHPPGQPEKLRDAHLPAISVPVLQFSGTDDEFCTRELMERVPLPESYKVEWVEGADHSYSVKKSSGRTRKDAEAQIVAGLRRFLAGIMER